MRLMSGQIAIPGSLELVALVVGASMLLGAVDVIRQPRWAWQRAEENKPTYLILVLLLPLIGLGMYAFKARPKLVTLVSAGPEATLPSESVGDGVEENDRMEEGDSVDQDDHVEKVDNVPLKDNFVLKEHTDRQSAESPQPAFGFNSFGDLAALNDPPPAPEATPPSPPGPVEVSATFFSNGGTATHTARHHLGLARSYRPKQRTSLPVPDNETPTVPAGWKSDPTERHQFRYWDGFHWTENVADAGHQTRDSVSS
jgi:hypothetical protein